MSLYECPECGHDEFALYEDGDDEDILRVVCNYCDNEVLVVQVIDE